MMFVLGACCEQDPPRIVLGLKSHVLGQLCNKVLVFPYFVVAKREGVMSHKGLSALILSSKVGFKRSTHGS